MYAKFPIWRMQEGPSKTASIGLVIIANHFHFHLYPSIIFQLGGRDGYLMRMWWRGGYEQISGHSEALDLATD
jgi:hypothetical protein